MDVRSRYGCTAAVATVVALAAVACAVGGPQPAAPQTTHEGLNSTLWAQTAVEYRGAALQAYRLATLQLERALADPGWTASLEQAAAGGFENLPPAVILDVDETVLDNSGYQARLVLREEEFATATWHDWAREVKATPISGALEFTRAATARGVTVFYVTNRRHEVEWPTLENLARYGFPLAPERDVLLTRGERPEWGPDKGSRRETVAADFRVLLLVGDNLGDFRSGATSTLADRDAMYASEEDHWGTRWIVVPNPQYGSWEGALIDYRYALPRQEKLQLKFGALDSMEGQDE